MQKLPDGIQVAKLPEKVTVTILCFYLGIKVLLQKHMSLTNNCEIHTIDSYQERETNIVLLATTRTSSGPDTNPEAMRLFLHDERITVALSRAQHGLFIIGDFMLLMRHTMWRRYLMQAIQATLIVTAATIFN